MIALFFIRIGSKSEARDVKRVVTNSQIKRRVLFAPAVLQTKSRDKETILWPADTQPTSLALWTHAARFGHSSPCFVFGACTFHTRIRPWRPIFQHTHEDSKSRRRIYWFCAHAAGLRRLSWVRELRPLTNRKFVITNKHIFNDRRGSTWH